jgi:hypothetical protein
MKPFRTPANENHRLTSDLRSVRDFTDAELSTQLLLMSPKLRLVESRFRDRERNLTIRFRQ